MTASLSPAFDTRKVTGTAGGAHSGLGTATHYRHQPPHNDRIELDLGRPAGFTLLRRMSLSWPSLPDAERHAWLGSLDIIPPPRAIASPEVVLLPGGAVALRGPDAIMVCDPIDTVIFSQAEVKHLRRVLRVKPDVSTLLHTADGVIPRQSVPKTLARQAVTIVPNPSRLPIRVAFNGATVIQWGLHGAVARPLVTAPPLLALAASIVPSPRAHRGADFGPRGLVIDPGTWQAVDAADRWRLIASALMEHVSEVIGEAACDELKFAVMEACVNGPDSLAARIAKALSVLPACFVADPDSTAGAPPAVWRHAMAHIRGQAHPRTLLALDELADPVAAVRALRGIVEHAEVMAVGGDDEVPARDPVLSHPVSSRRASSSRALASRTAPPRALSPAVLTSDTALFLARQARPSGRLAVVIPTPVSPVDLYVLADEAARVTGGRVIAVAPCWDFCHRIGADGTETGNAGWFGMGAGLDEVDIVLGDLELDW